MLRRHVVMIMLAASAATFAAAVPARATTPTAWRAIGDSVMIDAAPSLRAMLPGIAMNLRTSRQVEDGIAILRVQKQQHSLGATTIFGLGTNGTLTSSELSTIIGLTTGHKLVMVTTHCDRCSWTVGNDKVIHAGCTAAHHCWVADFEAHAHLHPEYFSDDGVHMPQYGKGAKVYATYVRAACHEAHVS